MQHNRPPILPWIVLAAGGLIGCGGPEATLTGTVSLDETPLTTGRVSFIPVSGGSVASAAIQGDGAFEARTADSVGIVPGQYAVTVRAFEPGKPSRHGGPPSPGKLLTPKRYGSSKTSGLEVAVEPGDQVYDISLTSTKSK